MIHNLFGAEKELLRVNENIVQILDNYWWIFTVLVYGYCLPDVT